MEELVPFLILVPIIIGFPVIFLYKYRHQVKRFISEPEYGHTWKPSRKTVLKRRIEDAEDEMSWLDKQDTEVKGDDID